MAVVGRADTAVVIAEADGIGIDALGPVIVLVEAELQRIDPRGRVVILVDRVDRSLALMGITRAIGRANEVGVVQCGPGQLIVRQRVRMQACGDNAALVGLDVLAQRRPILGRHRVAVIAAGMHDDVVVGEFGQAVGAGEMNPRRGEVVDRRIVELVDDPLRGIAVAAVPVSYRDLDLAARETGQRDGRAVVDGGQVQVHRRGDAGGTVAQHVIEAVGAVEVGGRRVCEVAVRAERDGAAAGRREGAGVGDAQCIAVDVRIVGQHVADDGGVLGAAIGVGAGDRRVVYGGDVDRHRRRRGATVAVGYGVFEAGGAVEIGVRREHDVAGAVKRSRAAGRLTDGDDR